MLVTISFGDIIRGAIVVTAASFVSGMIAGSYLAKKEKEKENS